MTTSYSVPVLKLGDILLTTLQHDLDDDDVVALQRQLLTSVNHHQALGIVIDISALDVVDSFMARAINDTAQALRLVGASVVVSGVQPYVAVTLVEMGRTLFNVETTFNLEQGIERLKLRLEAES